MLGGTPEVECLPGVLGTVPAWGTRFSFLQAAAGCKSQPDTAGTVSARGAFWLLRALAKPFRHLLLVVEHLQGGYWRPILQMKKLSFQRSQGTGWRVKFLAVWFYWTRLLVSSEQSQKEGLLSGMCAHCYRERLPFIHIARGVNGGELWEWSGGKGTQVSGAIHSQGWLPGAMSALKRGVISY